MKKTISAITISVSIILAAVLIYTQPLNQLPQTQAIPEEQGNQQLQYFANLTAVERNSQGQINKVIFEDGSAFQVDHYIRISSAGFNKYYNITYQAPDQLISIQEYVGGSKFQ